MPADLLPIPLWLLLLCAAFAVAFLHELHSQRPITPLVDLAFIGCAASLYAALFSVAVALL